MDEIWLVLNVLCELPLSVWPWGLAALMLAWPLMARLQKWPRIVA